MTARNSSKQPLPEPPASVSPLEFILGNPSELTNVPKEIVTIYHSECTKVNTLKNLQCILQIYVPQTMKKETLQGKNHITKCIRKINYIACAHGPESFAKGNFF